MAEEVLARSLNLAIVGGNLRSAADTAQSAVCLLNLHREPWFSAR